MKLKRNKLYQFNDDNFYFLGETPKLNYIGIAVKDYKLRIIMSNSPGGYYNIGNVITYNKWSMKEYIKSGKLVKID